MNIKEMQDKYLLILKELNDTARRQIEALPKYLDPRSRTRELMRIERERQVAGQSFMDELVRIEMLNVPNPVYIQRNLSMPPEIKADTLPR